MTDDRLAVVLASVGRHLVIDRTPDGECAPTELQRRRWCTACRRMVAAAAAVLVLTGAVASIAPARRAVGGWLRAGGIDISVDPEVGHTDSDLPSFIDGATGIEPGRIAALLGRPPPDLAVTSLGEPGGWWTVPEGGVVATWDQGETSLWIVPTDAQQSRMIDKFAASTDTVTGLPQLGDGGFAVGGTHELQTRHRRVAADSVVAWSGGGLTFRLESSIDLDDLISIAEAIAAG